MTIRNGQSTRTRTQLTFRQSNVIYPEIIRFISESARSSLICIKLNKTELSDSVFFSGLKVKNEVKIIIVGYEGTASARAP